MFFTFEVVVLFCGIGLRNYFANSWNTMDFFVVIASLIDFSFYLTPGLNFPLNISFLRTLRLLRALRVLKEYKRFTLLLKTLMYFIFNCVSLN